MSFDFVPSVPLAIGVVALLGALVVVATKEVMRLIFGLGTVLLSVAAFFAVAGASFLAVAEVFVYVGGVLVLFLFAIMLVHRAEGTRPVIQSRPDVLSLVIAAGTFFMIVSTLQPAVSTIEPAAMKTGVEALSTALLDPLLAHFELAGVLLLGALVAVVAILGEVRR